MSVIDDMIRGIVNREGGFSNVKGDKGGPTKYGITQATLSAWRHKQVSVDDVKNLTLDEAFQIYKKQYVDDPGFLKISDEALAEQLVDAGVNHYPTQAIKMLQEAIGVSADGVLGSQTLNKVASMDRVVVYIKFMAIRLRYYAHILQRDSTQYKFAAGWMNRCAMMIELYTREVTMDAPHHTAIWNTAAFLRQKAIQVQKSTANRPLSIGWFNDASAELAAALAAPQI